LPKTQVIIKALSEIKWPGTTEMKQKKGDGNANESD
jgi:hypothetical protein